MSSFQTCKACNYAALCFTEAAKVHFFRCSECGVYFAKIEYRTDNPFRGYPVYYRGLRQKPTCSNGFCPSVFCANCLRCKNCIYWRERQCTFGVHPGEVGPCKNYLADYETALEVNHYWKRNGEHLVSAGPSWSNSR